MKLKLKPFKQSYGMCGAACIKMIMDYYGIKHSENYWAKLIANKIDKKTGKINIFYGSSEDKMLSTAKSLGFNKNVFKQLSTIKEIKKYIKKNIPVIVNWFSKEEGGHFSVVVGFEKDKILLADPHFGAIKKHNLEEFEDRWFDFVGPPSKDNLIAREIVTWYK
jgi:ABC-type bacteriocin/lantibiotic exporter with double-glycine peptidase domain